MTFIPNHLDGIRIVRNPAPPCCHVNRSSIYEYNRTIYARAVPTGQHNGHNLPDWQHANRVNWVQGSDLICHNDEAHPHLHIIVNKVHQQTGMAADTRNSKRKLQAFASDYERETKIYCHQREQNREKREKGEPSSYADRVIVEAWEQSDCGKSFASALAAKGYRLARGCKRLVVVDPHGKVINPLRHLPGVKTRAFKQRLSDLDFDRLPDASLAKKQVKQANQSDYESRWRHRQALSDMLNALQDRQITERSAVFSKHHRRISREQENLATYYQIGNQEREVLALERKVRRAGFWQRLVGLKARWGRKLDRLKLSLSDACDRFDERIQALENRRDNELAELDGRYANERLQLQNLMQDRAPP